VKSGLERGEGGGGGQAAARRSERAVRFLKWREGEISGVWRIRKLLSWPLDHI
jgi:hypothetical protein